MKKTILIILLFFFQYDSYAQGIEDDFNRDKEAQEAVDSVFCTIALCVWGDISGENDGEQCLEPLENFTKEVEKGLSSLKKVTCPLTREIQFTILSQCKALVESGFDIWKMTSCD